MIIFDCEKMKFPNTGLYYFCDNLGRALIQELEDSPEDLVFYLRKHLTGHFGPDCKYQSYRSADKYFSPVRMKDDIVWHSTFQFPKSMPSKGNIVLTIHDLNFLYDEPSEKKIGNARQSAESSRQGNTHRGYFQLRP